MIRLIIALHGVGSNAADIAAAVAGLAPATGIEIIALDGPEPFDMAPTGRQWFSVRGVTEATRVSRVAAAVPTVLAMLDREAAQRGLTREEIAVLGFSQGAIMALAALAGGAGFGCTIAIAGRLAAPVLPARSQVGPVALVHDRHDPVMPVALAAQAETALRAAGYAPQLVVTDGYGHAIGPATLAAIAAILTPNIATQEILR